MFDISKMDEKDHNKRFKKTIGRIISLTKPKGVEDIYFDINHLVGNEFSISLNYVVPDDSEALNFKDSDKFRLFWNKVIMKTIEDYLGIKIFVSDSAITSKSFHIKNKL